MGQKTDTQKVVEMSEQKKHIPL